jgi:hypothetical protein
MLQLRGPGTFGWFSSCRSIGFVMSSVGVVGGEKNDERAMEKTSERQVWQVPSTGWHAPERQDLPVSGGQFGGKLAVW